MTYLDKIPSIKALVFDVDGVLTDGKVVLLPNGEQMRQMHSKDGYALQLAVKKGYHVGIITGGRSIQVKERVNALGITDCYLGSSHKDEAMEDFMHTYGLDAHEIMYMGDDIPDLAAMHIIGLPSCPADASPEVKSVCEYVSKIRGGEGCVRDIIEKVLRVQGNWFRADDESMKIADFTW